MCLSRSAEPARKVVLDSNIIISVLNANDVLHVDAQRLVDLLNEGQYEILVPALHLWEMHAYHRHPDKMKSHKAHVEAQFKVTTYDVTSELFFRTLSDAMVCVKGPDRVFVSLARDHGVPLVTNDGQVLRNAADLGVRALSIADFLVDQSDPKMVSNV